MATGEHTFEALPIVIAGGAGAFRIGRYVRWTPIATVAGLTGLTRVGPPHNRLLVTLGRAMGADLDAFGEEDFEADDGKILDATDGLDRV